jgi:hypothetical protein
MGQWLAHLAIHRLRTSPQGFGHHCPPDTAHETFRLLSLFSG